MDGLSFSRVLRVISALSARPDPGLAVHRRGAASLKWDRPVFWRFRSLWCGWYGNREYFVIFL